jgi:MFS-type transporter involved in bile tolerance (Atg22 family)
MRAENVTRKLTFVIFAVLAGLLAARFGLKRITMVGIGSMLVLTLYGLRLACRST